MIIYSDIIKAAEDKKRLLAVLIDPDKFSLDTTACFINLVNQSLATHIFVGGSVVEASKTDLLIRAIKEYTDLPIVLFPGDLCQISIYADAILFLSLISGRNPDYLIDKHVKSVSILKGSNLEIIPTGYVLIESGHKTAVEQVTQTKPLSRKNIQKIVDTAKAGELLGMKMIYLEAGSGTKLPLTNQIINSVKKIVNIPLIVGGGIRTKKQLDQAYLAGADLVVIGTAFEKNMSFFKEIKR